MKVDDFDFHLPQELIAQTPLSQRDQSRLLVVDKSEGSFTDRVFPDILDHMRTPDVLVLNDTKVLPARLYGQNSASSGPVEILLLRPRAAGCWEALVKPGKRAKLGANLFFSTQLSGKVLNIKADGTRLIEFHFNGDFNRILETLGETPLPPYIYEKLAEPARYQTVYACNSGSVAAPTAGLHFTPELLDKIRSQGIAVVFLTLHVGLGTFRPVRVELVEDHVMHEEYYEVTETAATLINARKQAGGKVFAVGTTSVRVLESVTDSKKCIQAGAGLTDIFIYSGYKFKMVDAVITNFHLPRSSLLMLVSAFSGSDLIRRAYEHAVTEHYRFFSFGDAMLLL